MAKNKKVNLKETAKEMLVAVMCFAAIAMGVGLFIGVVGWVSSNVPFVDCYTKTEFQVDEDTVFIETRDVGCKA